MCGQGPRNPRQGKADRARPAEVRAGRTCSLAAAVPSASNQKRKARRTKLAGTGATLSRLVGQPNRKNIHSFPCDRTARGEHGTARARATPHGRSARWARPAVLSRAGGLRRRVRQDHPSPCQNPVSESGYRGQADLTKAWKVVRSGSSPLLTPPLLTPTPGTRPKAPDPSDSLTGGRTRAHPRPAIPWARLGRVQAGLYPRATSRNRGRCDCGCVASQSVQTCNHPCHGGPGRPVRLQSCTAPRPP